MTQLSPKTLGAIATFVSEAIEEVDSKMEKLKFCETLTGNEEFNQFVGGNWSEMVDELPKERKKLEVQKIALEYVRAECMESVTDFANAYHAVVEIHKLEKKFKAAPAWSLEEKNAYVAMIDFTAENLKYIGKVQPDGRDATVEDVETERNLYLSKWEEKNAGK